jgi:hypothetical protein
MKTRLIALALIFLSTAAGAKSAAVVCTPGPLLDARAVAFSLHFGGTASPLDDPGLYLFRGQPEGQAAFEARLTSAIEAKLRDAGYSFETDIDLWETKDRTIYDGTDIPHYQLFVSVYGQALDSPSCDCTSNAFLVYVSLNAEFLTPGYEAVETYSAESLGIATDSELGSEIIAVTSAMVNDILEPSNGCPYFEKKTTLLEGARYSLDVTSPGFGEVLRSLRHEFYGEPVVADLYSEPRSSSAEPLATFSLINGVLPKRILRNKANGFVVALQAWPSRGYESSSLIVIYRPDGSILHSLSLTDLLTTREWFHIVTPTDHNQWPQIHHFIDDRKNVLLLSIPTCLFFEQDCSHRYAQLEVDLSTGQRVHPDREITPRWGGQFELIRVQKQLAKEEQTRSTAYTCRSGRSADEFVEVPRTPIENFLPDSPLPMPAYTVMASKTRVTGTVGIDILLSKSGEIVCAGIRKGLPMGLDESAIETVLTWKLTPPQSYSGQSRSYVEFRCYFALVESGKQQGLGVVRDAGVAPPL